MNEQVSFSCPNCGEPLEDGLNFCGSCGNQIEVTQPIMTTSIEEYNSRIQDSNNLKSKTRDISKLIPLVIAVVLLITTIYEYYIIQKKNNDLIVMEDQIYSLTGQVSQLEDEVFQLEDDISIMSSKNYQLQQRSDFMDEYIALVSDDDTYQYHTLGCYRFDSTYFWAYNINQAWNLGFSECSYCH
ncbi:hypothetical protein E9840_04450 [Tissierella creatinini]|nr:hypothetical protein E9840_04450 [Tissierella creatinini]TJX61014.1 hypothetical protein E8P77_19130 [Soehngenia saccharolytica]